MKKNKETLQSIAINIISNIIFQIVLIIISSSGIIYTMRKIVKSLKDNKINISVFSLIILILSCVVITISIVLFCRTMILKKKNTEKNNFNDIEDYYFSEYEKHITIYQNGNGIIIHKFKVIANDINKLTQIRRKLNIEDGVKEAKFPSLDKMMQTNKGLRFNEFGFWYKSDNDIISEVRERYWDPNSSNENKKIKNNSKELRWIFKVNKNKVETGIPYEICYVISVPGLAPLENGNLNKTLLNDPAEEYSFSSMRIDHKIQHLKYTISFEDGISIETSPQCKCIISEQDREKELDISGIEDYDVLYRKYVFSIENPVFGSNIKIAWKYNIL